MASLSGRVRHYWQPRLRGTAHMTIARQLSLLCVCSSKSSIVSSGFLKLRLMSISFRSVLVHSIQVLVGRPGGLRTGLRNSAIACLAGVSGCSLMVWPRKLSLRLLMVILQGSHLANLYKLEFDSLLFHLIFRILRRSVLWKTSILWLILTVRVHTSLLYRKMLATCAWNTLSSVYITFSIK